MFHPDRGKEFDNNLISEALETFGIRQSLCGRSDFFVRYLKNKKPQPCKMVAGKGFHQEQSQPSGLYRYGEGYFLILFS